MHPTVSYNLISKYRTELMGLAILWIFLYHSKIFFPEIIFFHPLRFLVSTGYGGVDIFFFLSGFGLMRHMLVHNSGWIVFYKKRIENIYPAYLLATVPALWIDHFFFDNVSLKKTIYCLTATGFWLDNSMFYWFIPAILSLYIAYPLLYKYYLQYGFKLIIIVTIVSILSSIALTITGNGHLIQVISRVPIFLIGSHVSYILSNNSTALTGKELFFQLAAFLFSFGLLLVLMLLPLKFDLKDYGLAYFLFTTGTLPLCLFSAMILDKLAQLNPPGKAGLLSIFLATCGSVSLELYLVHKQIVFKVGEILLAKLPNFSNPGLLPNYGHYVEYTLYFTISMLLALGLHSVSTGIRTRIRQWTN